MPTKAVDAPDFSREWSTQILSIPAAETSLQALKDAVEIFNSEVSAKKRGELIDKKVEFSSLLHQAKKDLEECTRKPEPEKSKLQHAWYQTKRGLEKFCKYAHQYAGVMDVLVSSHPEIAALVWGAMKFLLVVSVHHQELKAQITYHLGEIGAKFQIMECFAQLYPTETMVSNVSGAYTELLAFLRKSIEWCKEAVLVKFFKTVFSSYETRIKPTIDNLNDYMEKIRTSAEVNRSIGIYNLQAGNLGIQNLMAAFGRDMYLQVQESREFQSFMRQYIATERTRRNSIEMKLQTLARIDKQVFKNSTTLRKSLFPELLTQEQHFEQNATSSRRMPKGTSYIDLGILSKAEASAWIESDDSCLIWIDGFINPGSDLKWTTELAVDVTLAGDSEGYTMLFYFCDLSSTCEEADRAYIASQFAMLHSFIIQILQQHPTIIGRYPEYFNIDVFKSAKENLKITLTIFREALNALPEETTVCIVIDSIDDLQGAKEKSPKLRFILEKLSELVSKPRSIKVKIMVTSVNSIAHRLLFKEPEKPPQAHSILRIPRGLENAHAVQPPSHLRRRIPKRLVRVPDSNNEFGMKPVDSFELSDDHDDGISDASLDDSVCDPATELRTKPVSADPESSKPSMFKTLREMQLKGDGYDTGSSSEISISDDENAEEVVQMLREASDEEDFDLSSTDSEN